MDLDEEEDEEEEVLTATDLEKEIQRKKSSAHRMGRYLGEIPDQPAQLLKVQHHDDDDEDEGKILTMAQI